MKKGVVMEKYKRYLVVMTNEGEFLRTNNRKNAELGDEINFIPLPSFSFLTIYNNKIYSVPLAVAVVLLMIFPMFSFLSPERVYGVVAIDMNPSLEFSLDDQYDVIGTKGYNSRGNELLNQLENQLIGQSLSQAVELSIEKGNELGYLEDEQNVYITSFLLITEDSWGEDYELWTESMHSKFSVNFITLNVDDEVMDKAKALSLSPTKYILFNESKQRGANVELGQVTNTPIHDLEVNTGVKLREIVTPEKMKVSAPRGNGPNKEKNANQKEESNNDSNINGSKHDEEHPSNKNPGKNKEKDHSPKTNSDKSKGDDHPSKNNPSNSNKKNSEDHPSQKKWQNSNSNQQGNSQKDVHPLMNRSHPIKGVHPSERSNGKNGKN